ncbi:MAG TPA: hypothetical protein VGV68_06465 [Terriglobia bacterium]|nr:hypothetical protein [Terriglobia bacterium]
MSQKNKKQTQPKLTQSAGSSVIHGSYPTSPPDADHSHNYSRYKKRDAFDYVTSVVTIIGLIILIIYTIYAGRQAYWMRRSVENSALSERPWIEVATVIGFEHPNYAGNKPIYPILPDIPLFRNFPYNFVVTTKNYGRTPALRVYADFDVKWSDLPGTVEPYLKNIMIPVYERCQVGFPFSGTGNEAEFPNGTYEFRTPRAIFGGEEVDRFLQVKEAVFIYGCVRYKDVGNLNSREFYQTDFCRYLWLGDTPHSWKPCVAGNGVR